MFKVGDTVIHPNYGAGVVVEIKERRSLGGGKRYYSIELLCQQGTIVMVPVGTEEDFGLRRPIPKSRLGQIWSVLRSSPEVLPSKHQERYELLKEKLHGGDALEIAEAVRDLAWRREEKRHLTVRGKRLYDKGMEFLAGEVASAQDTDVETAEMQISKRLPTSMA